MIMKVYGLLNLPSIFILENFNINFENAVNAVYKMSEDGAEGIVIKGNFSISLRLFSYLKGRMDIPIFLFIRSEREFEKAKMAHIRHVFSEKEIKGSKQLKILRASSTINESKDTILVEDRRVQRIFGETEDYLPELIGILSFRLCEVGCKTFITEEVRSAKAGVRLYKKLKQFIA